MEEEKKVTLKKNGEPRKIRTDYSRVQNTAPRSDIGSRREPAKPGDKRLGNTYNMLRKTFGKPKLFKSPQILASYAMDYIDDCANHPIIKNDSIKSGNGAGTTFPVPMPRIPSLKGFASYLGVTARMLANYGTEQSHKEFHDTYQMIKDAFDTELLENALVGNCDPRLAAAIQGIREKQELKIMPALNFDKDDANA